MSITIKRVQKVQAIENYDKTELVTVEGKEFTRTKGHLKENDLCLYITVGTFLPESTNFDFLGEKIDYNGQKGWVVGTKELKNGIKSNGLILPLEYILRVLKENQNLDQVFGTIN